MTEPQDTEVVVDGLPAGLAAQAAEAAEQARKPKTKMVMWRDRPWTVRSKPGARFLAAYEEDKIMTAVRSILIPSSQYDDLLELDPDVDGDDGLEGFVTACNRAWGMTPGN